VASRAGALLVPGGEARDSLLHSRAGAAGRSLGGGAASAGRRAGAVWASSYCVRKGLTRKAHLAHNTRKWAAKHPAGRLAAAVPETWPLELDDPEYVDEALCDVPEVRTRARSFQVRRGRWGARAARTLLARGPPGSRSKCMRHRGGCRSGAARRRGRAACRRLGLPRRAGGGCRPGARRECVRMRSAPERYRYMRSTRTCRRVFGSISAQTPRSWRLGG